MHRVFVLRAYGDFIIFLQALLKSDFKKDYHIVASKHLQPIFFTVSKFVDTSAISIEFIDFGIQKTLLSFFTNRYFFSLDTVKELFNIKNWLRNNPNKQGVDYLEQDKRIIGFNLIMGQRFSPILRKENVYETYNRFFQISQNHEINTGTNPINNIVIFPDSRLPAKNIPDVVLKNIATILKQKDKQVQVAYFKQAPKKENHLSFTILYDSFDDLLALIQKADFIIGADSLPIHLANLLNTPHYILYPKGFTQLFITPWAKQRQYFGNFEEYHFSFID
jgi:ADP-heptose:LPS heptosyltransferase